MSVCKVPDVLLRHDDFQKGKECKEVVTKRD